MKRLWLVFVLLAGLAAAGFTTLAQQTPVVPAAVQPAPPLVAPPPVVPAYQVPAYQQQRAAQEAYDRDRKLQVAVLAVRNLASPDSSRFKLNDYVTLVVRDLRLALRRAPGRSAQSLRLYVDDIMIPIPPTAVDTIHQRDVATVRFQLLRNEQTEAIWQIFYRVPGKYEHPGRFNIGFENGQLGQAFPAGNERLHLELIKQRWLWLGGLLLLLILGVFFWLAGRSNLIRSDLAPSPRTQDAEQADVICVQYGSLPFSLAKSQMAFWTLIGVGSYLMISMVTSALPVIPEGLLGLLGISATNSLLSNFINKQHPYLSAHALSPGPGQHGIGKSRGWVQDVLTDINGISVIRLQFVIFNIVVGIYTLRHVFRNWSLPDLDSSVLALISISSASFLIQKNSETSGPATATSPATTPPAATTPATAPAARPPEDDNMAPPPAAPAVAPPNLALG